HGVVNAFAVVARSVVLDDGTLRRGAALAVDDIGPEDERRRALDNPIDLADLVVLGDRGGTWLVQLRAVFDADADPGLADVDRAHLLIDQLLFDRLLRVGLQFLGGNVRRRAHVARRLRIGGVDLRLR